jgi:Immunity protein 21
MGLHRGELTWIYSEGGPLLLLSQEHLAAWEGSDPPSGGREVQAIFRYAGVGSSATDYDRACDVTDYLALLGVGQGQGLVLGDEPFQTAWWLDQHWRGMLVRWRWAEDEASAIQALSRIPDPVWEETGLVFTSSGSPLYLFDSACPGDELLDHLSIDLSQGSYSIATGILQPDRQTSLLLHRFTLQG